MKINKILKVFKNKKKKNSTKIVVFNENTQSAMSLEKEITLIDEKIRYITKDLIEAEMLNLRASLSSNNNPWNSLKKNWYRNSWTRNNSNPFIYFFIRIIYYKCSW